MARSDDDAHEPNAGPLEHVANRAPDAGRVDCEADIAGDRWVLH